MKSKHAATRWVLISGVMLMLRVGAYAQQVQAIDPITNPPSILPADSAPPPDLSSDLAARQAKLVNDSRQKQLVLDTGRLIALANELKLAVDKADKNTLSLDVVRKADEIERLAHTIKEKMKGT